MYRIKVAIADDYEVFRDGLKAILPDDHIEVVLEAANGRELLDGLVTSTPDVILLDLNMPQLSGLEATRIIKKEYPAIKVLVISMYEDEKFRQHLLQNGADGYLLKNAEPEEIRAAIYTVTGYNSHQ